MKSILVTRQCTRRTSIVAVALALVAMITLNACDSRKPGRLNTAITFTDCRIKRVDSVARCATLAVPEDYADKTGAGKTINIHVAVLPALARNPEPDPVYFFAGGPGQAASDIGGLVSALGDLRKSRDIVLVDQRGTGKSKTLTCDSIAADPNVDPLKEAFSNSEEAVQRDWAKCIATLKGNAATHRTDDYIDDLELVRKALGQDKVNVWGGSYGSRVALRYMKRYPQSIRTAILDGVAPTSLHLPDDALATSEAELRSTLAACASSAGCNKAFPNILATFDTLLAELRATPRSVSFAHPASGKTISGVVSDRTLVSLIWPLLYMPEAARMLPALIDQAAQGNFAPLAATMSASSIGEGDIAIAQRFAVMCAEDMLNRTPMANPRFQALNNLFYGFCKGFPHGKVAPEFFEPTKSDIPTLLLSGTQDPVTPPAQGSLAAKTLLNSKHVVVAGVGHITSPQPCVRRIITKFIEAGDIAAANDACEAELKLPRPLFYTSPLEATP
ncbi:MAG: alpha/beta fold hydrolase [Casimicrobium sp.]